MCQQFRLKNTDERRNYLLEKIKQKKTAQKGLHHSKSN